MDWIDQNCKIHPPQKSEYKSLYLKVKTLSEGASHHLYKIIYDFFFTFGKGKQIGAIDLNDHGPNIKFK